MKMRLFDGTMYETYGAELDFVFSVSQAGKYK
jgi:hypothetical protein